MKKLSTMFAFLFVTMAMFAFSSCSKEDGGENTSEVVPTPSNPISLRGVKFDVDTVDYPRLVGPGTEYAFYKIPKRPLTIHVLKMDLNNPYLKLETCLAGDVGECEECPTSMASRKNKPGHEVVGVTNGDFYFYHDTYGNGIPRSGQFHDNECITNPTGRASFVLDVNKKPHIDRVDFTGTLNVGSISKRLHTVNMLRLETESTETNENILSLYTNAFGPKTTDIAGGTKVVIRPKSGTFFFSANCTIPCIVDKVYSNSGTSEIPTGKALLHGQGSSSSFLSKLSVGDELSISLKTVLRSQPDLLKDFTELMGGSDNILLRNGEISPDVKGVETSLNPRTGIGFSKDSTKVYLMVIDGRSSNSNGVQMDEFGEIFKYFGAWNAVNMDGGGSSVMAVNGVTVNVPSDGHERAVGNSMLVVSTAPADDDIKMLSFDSRAFVLPVNYRFTPVIWGLNKYGVLKNSDLKGFKLTCTSSLGHIENDNVLVVAKKAGYGTLTATYNGVSATKNVRVYVP